MKKEKNILEELEENKEYDHHFKFTIEMGTNLDSKKKAISMYKKAFEKLFESVSWYGKLNEDDGDMFYMGGQSSGTLS